MSSKTKSTAPNDEAKPALVPKLRFPEFQGTGWEERTLGSIGSFASGGTPSKDNPDYWNGSIPWVSASSMYDLVVEKADHYVTPLAIGKGTRIAKKGSILILVRGSMLFNRVPICIAGINVAFNQDVKALDVDPSIDTCFLLYQLSAFQSRFPINETGIGAGKIELDHLKDFGVFIPARAEQQKIAECLSSVDELMAAQARKVDALKTHKKGLMQQLFPREGETQPRLRFPAFQTAGEWESQMLGELGEIITGKTPSTKEADLWGGDILFITPTDISEAGKYQHTAARTVVETKSTKVLPAGSIVYTCIASIGKMALTVTPSITNQQINAVVPNKRALGEFLYYALANLTPWIKIIPATNTLPIINKTDFSKIAILHPGKDEQQRIADCLSSLDALITAETQKLDALKTHKKGLMQQLFPSTEEVET